MTTLTHAEIDAADQAGLAAIYVDMVGYDPFEDDPKTTVEHVRQTLHEHLDLTLAGGLDGEES